MAHYIGNPRVFDAGGHIEVLWSELAWASLQSDSAHRSSASINVLQQAQAAERPTAILTTNFDRLLDMALSENSIRSVSQKDFWHFYDSFLSNDAPTFVWHSWEIAGPQVVDGQHRISSAKTNLERDLSRRAIASILSDVVSEFGSDTVVDAELLAKVRDRLVEQVTARVRFREVQGKRRSCAVAALTYSLVHGHALLTGTSPPAGVFDPVPASGRHATPAEGLHLVSNSRRPPPRDFRGTLVRNPPRGCFRDRVSLDAPAARCPVVGRRRRVHSSCRMASGRIRRASFGEVVHPLSLDSQFRRGWVGTRAPLRLAHA